MSYKIINSIKKNSAMAPIVNNLLEPPYKSFVKYFNSLAGDRVCYLCKKRFRSFKKYRGGHKNKSDFSKLIQAVGSDIDNFECMYCGCHDRIRHLFMYFDKLKLWETMRGDKILHFAPEPHLQEMIVKYRPSKYIKGDLYPYSKDQIKIDITNIQFKNNTFDFVIANHVLEHIPNYMKAIKELHRVLKPGGVAILQTPYSDSLKYNFELSTIDSGLLRLKYYGQEDHVRYFSGQQLLMSIEKVGFKSKIKRHLELFDERSAYKYGVNLKEDLIMFEKYE